MPIRSQEIDPTIQQALKERMTQIFGQNTALDPMAARVRSAGLQVWRSTWKKYVSDMWIGGTLFVGGLLTPALIAPTNEGAAALTSLLMFAAGVGFMARSFVRTNRDLTQYASADLLRTAAHLVALSRSEQLYCEAVAALIDAGAVLSDSVQQDILRQLNELLASHRKLEKPAQQFRAASGNSTLEELTREVADLTQRRDQAGNTEARSALEQSIALCTRRLEQARALQPAREQADAQQELILQTMAAVQASLANIGAAPMAPAETHLAELHDSVVQINRQTRAVEDAVAEVMTLSAGS